LRLRFALVAFGAALALAFSVNGCGSSGEKNVALTIGARATPEEEILGHIYVDALRQAGFKVKGVFGIETEARDAPLRELEGGRISGFPEHVDAALEEIASTGSESLPKQPQEAYRQAKAALEKEGLTALPPTPYSRNRRLAVLKRTAEAHHLKAISDLKGQSEHLTMSGPTDCHFAADCLAGFERFYGVYFESISYTYTDKEIRDRFKVLEDGSFDASIVNNTDGQLAESDKFVLLEDDKHVLPAGNAIFVTRPKVVEEAGEELEKTVVAVQRGLTLPAMQRLNAEVELEGKDAAEAAADYLKGARLPG
jgi:glycine betaine/choline ABC-type transport system substrate-binding protein